MKKLVLLSLAFLPVFLHPILAQESLPAWVLANGDAPQYPAEKFYTGYGIGMSGNLAASRETARKTALRNLAESIQTRIRTETVLELSEQNEEFSERFFQDVRSSAALDVQNIRFEQYQSKTDQQCYALAIVNKADLAQGLQTALEQDVSALQNTLERMAQLESSNQKEAALQLALSAQPKLADLNSKLALANACAPRKFADLRKRVLETELQMQVFLDRLNTANQESIDQTAASVALWLSRQANITNETVLFLPPTYRDTRIASSFARYFNQVLRDKILSITQCRVVEQGASPSSEALTTFRVEGTYWEASDVVRLNFVIRKGENGNVLASAPAVVSTAAIRKLGLEVVPFNLTQAQNDQTAFQNNEIDPSGINLEVWTNKGADNLIFAEGEMMHIYVRTNIPCFLRLIYHLADGNRCLLLDNVYLDATQVNQIVTIPEDFTCAPPFGAENLQLFANSRQFEPLSIRKEGDYEFIESDLDDILAKSRGFVKGAKKTLKAEKRITITTVPR